MRFARRSRRAPSSPRRVFCFRSRSHRPCVLSSEVGTKRSSLALALLQPPDRRGEHASAEEPGSRCKARGRDRAPARDPDRLGAFEMPNPASPPATHLECQIPPPFAARLTCDTGVGARGYGLLCRRQSYLDKADTRRRLGPGAHRLVPRESGCRSFRREASCSATAAPAIILWSEARGAAARSWDIDRRLRQPHA